MALNNTDRYNIIPDELKENGLFCLVPVNVKIPYQCIADYYVYARTNDYSTFSNFDKAIDALKNSNNGKTNFSDIGLLITNGIGFLDFDHCIKNENVDEEIKSIIQNFDSYTEISQSGSGIHIYFYCDDFLNKTSKEEFKSKYYFRKNNKECYLSGLTKRYAIMTGKHYKNSPLKIREASQALESFLEKYLKKEEQNNMFNTEDDCIVEKLKHLESFQKLFILGDSSSYTSQSEADFHLACLIAKESSDSEQIKRIMLKSKLVRDKWFKHNSYLNLTISNAISKIREKQDIKLSQNLIPDDKFKKAKLIKAKDIKIKDIDWLWFPYIPRGTVTILSSQPGLGKTFLATWIAALVSSNKNFPISNERNTKGSGIVVYLSWEDDYKRTIIPRFIRNGGNPENFYILNKSEMPKCFTDPIIEKILEIKPDLIVFDALSSFIGKVNINSFSEVRNAFNPLFKAIEDSQTAILIIAHNNKMSNVTSAVERVSGSIDFVAAIRSGLSVGRDPEDPDRLIMAQFKNNLSELGLSLAFNFEEDSESTTPRLSFDSIVDITADQLLGAKKKVSPKLVEIKRQIQDLIKEHGGSCPAKLIKDELVKRGFKLSSINRAKNLLNVKHEIFRQNNRNITYWYLN